MKGEWNPLGTNHEPEAITHSSSLRSDEPSDIMFDINRSAVRTVASMIASLDKVQDNTNPASIQVA